MFPIEHLRQAVEIAKRILTKEKLDKQLTRQTSTSPFMSIREGIIRKVLFDTRFELGDKIDKLAVTLDRLAAKDNNEKRPFKPQIYQGRGREQNKGYSQRNYQNRNRLNNRSSSRDRGQFSDRPRFEQNYRGNNFQNNARGYGRQNSRGEYRNDSYRRDGYDRGRDRLRERLFSRIYSGNRDRSASSSRSRSGSRASTSRDRMRCYNCREYDHFVWDCPTSREERDLDQLQQMLNLEEQTHLLSSSCRQCSPMENSRTSP